MYDALYEKGIAVGEADIRRDEMNFFYKKEKFTFPMRRVHHLATYNGYFYESQVEKLRELKQELEKTP